MSYDHDMNGEDRVVFEMPDGWHDFEIVNLTEQKSKQNNDMFVAKVVSAEDYGVGCDVYLLAEKGKKWFLKQLLTACGIVSDEEGHMLWDIPDIEGKTVSGRIEHQQDKDWIDREGKTQPGKNKARIVEFKKMTV
jgi:hypothetical protein